MNKRPNITTCILSKRGLMPSRDTRERVSSILLGQNPKKGEQVTVLTGSNYNQPSCLLEVLEEHPDIWIVLVEPEEPDKSTRKLLFINCNKSPQIFEILRRAESADDSWQILLNNFQWKE